MINNYDSVAACNYVGATTSQKQEVTSYKATKRNWLSFVTLLVAMFSFVFVQGQTTLISPTGAGGFENGSTFAANGWTTVNPTTDTWSLGNVPVSASGSNCAYVSANGGTSWTYSQTSVFNHIYRDVTIPAGETKVVLSFKWKVGGEGTTTSDWDNMKVFIAPTTLTPLATAAVTGAIQLSGPGATSGMYKLSSTNWNTETITFSASPGTYRLIFSWKSDSLYIVNPPAAIDDISLTSGLPGTFISVTTGNWSTPATWAANAVPTSGDNAIVSSGHTVTADVATTSIGNLTVNGTLDYATACTNFSVSGNLTVASGGLVNVFTTTTGKTLTVAGNITNNGRVDVSVGTTTQGTLTLNGTTVQTVSGTGTFGGTVTSTTTTNTADVIRNLIINNTNTAIPNIIWSFNNIKIANNLTFTNAKVNIGTNKLTFGNFAAGGTLTASAPNGILPGGKFSRFWTATATGSAFTAGTDPSNGTSRYPFINTTGLNRAMYISRTNSTGAVAGELAVVYNDATTNSTGLSIVDGSYTVNQRFNGNWNVSTEGTSVSASSYSVALIAPNTLYPENGNARIVGANAAISGTHQNGTNTPGAQRITVSQADLISGPLFIGVATSDIPFVSVVNGNWNSPSTWNKNAVPTCTDNVTIAAGNNVTVNSASNVSKGIVITAGGTLVVASGTVTVGCTNNNSSLVNNGTLTVTGGTLTVNGNMLHNAGSIYNQSGGLIIVDGNAAGNATNSVASGTAIVQLNSQFVNWTGGVLTIPDPHANSTASNTLAYSNGIADVNVSNAHTLKLGNGVSTDAGGNATNGFRLNTWASSFRITFGNLEVNTLGGTNRIVTSTYTFGINGNVTIEPSSEISFGTFYVSGNIINKGILTSTSSLGLANYQNGVETVNTNPQTISGPGVFRNSATTITANLTSLTVNNSNATGVTLSVPLSISSTLTMTSGLVNTTNTNLLTLGTATAGGTLSGTPSATNMVKGPFARTIASGNANTSYILFPVGKSAYAPISLAPLTTAVSVMRAEAFDTNTGTQNPAINGMSTTRRWHAPIISGTVTNLNVRLGDAGILATSIPVQAATATGQYSTAFGSVATAVAGATTQSNTPITSANYTGFLSYANSNACVGTPAPGNTLASTLTVCSGNSVNLSLQNPPSSSGISYQWKSSTDGTTYTNITGATNATLSITPTQATFYRCEVTCVTGPTTATSTAVQITFANSITATTPATRCGVGTVVLGATPSTGATIKWYDAVTGGAALASGNSFTTPIISTSTTYYAASETVTSGTITAGTGTALTGATSQNSVFCNYWYQGWRQFVFTAAELQALGLSAGNITSLQFNIAALPSPATINNFAIRMGATTNSTLTAYQTTGLAVAFGPSNYTPTVGVNTITLATPYNWDGTSNIIIDIREDGQYGSSNATTFVTTTSTNTVLHSFSGTNNAAYYTSSPTPTASNTRPNVVFSGQVACQSLRSAVTATVTAPPVLTISAATATICNTNSTTPVTVTSPTTNFNTYVWSPATGVTGNVTTGWIFNPTVSTVYTLTATQTGGSLCANVATFSVTVNPLPSAITITPVNSSACVGVIFPMTATGGNFMQNAFAQPMDTVPSNFAVSTNATSALNTTYYAQGTGSILFNTASVSATATYELNQNINLIGAENASVKFSHIAAMEAGYDYGFVEYSTDGGTSWTTFTPADYVGSALTSVFNTNVRFTKNSYSDWNTIFTGTTSTPGVGPATSLWKTETFNIPATALASSQFRIRFRYTTDSSANFYGWLIDDVKIVKSQGVITWSPASNLFTNAAGTVPYVAGTSASTVYALPPSATPLTYQAISTNGSTGCFSSATITLSDTVAPIVITTPVSVLLNASGTASITAAQVNNGSTDNCGITTLVVTPSTFTCANIGPNTVTLTATDASGNATSVTAIVTVSFDFTTTSDNDLDGAPDNCDTDDDNDGILDVNDNCPLQANANQADNDNDGIGDACDNDDDNDFVLDGYDNCPFIYNPNQQDIDNDGVGDVCDTIEVNVSEAITPNGDGINDTWFINNIQNYPNNSVKVYNRWGDLIFSKNNYQNDWNGSYTKGENNNLISSSYYYQIDLDGNGSIDHQGWIFITK
jgi:gliding motility-associated-like protein